MNSMPRRAAVAVTALATLGALAGGPAHAEGGPDTATKNTDTRSFDRLQTGGTTGTGTSLATATATPVDRIAGSDRIDTAILASYAAWGDAAAMEGSVAQAVVLTRADQYADALGGSALAGAAGGPLLLTPSSRLDSDVEAEIRRVLAKGGTVYLLGGTGALSSTVESRLKTLGYAAKRLQGADRFATSVAVAQEVGAYLPPDGVPSFVMATTGLDFPDGLAAGATAGGYRATVVLTKGSTVPTVVANYLNHIRYLGKEYNKNVPFIAVGGQAAAAKIAWDERYAGKDRFETAALVATAFWADPTTPDDDPVAVGLATGMNWPDALAGGAFMAGGGPLLLSQTASLPASSAQAVHALMASTDPATPVQFGVIFGGESVVSVNAESQFSTALGN